MDICAGIEALPLRGGWAFKEEATIPGRHNVWKIDGKWEETGKRRENSEQMLWALVKGRAVMPRIPPGGLIQ